MKRKTSWIFLFLILGIIFLVLFYVFRSVTAILLVSLVLAYLLKPFVKSLTEHSVPISVSILICYGIFFMMIAFLVTVVIPVIVSEVQSVVHSLPIYYEYLLSFGNRYLANEGFFSILRELGLDEKIRNMLSEHTESLFDMTVRWLADIPQIILFVLLVPVISYYLLRDKDKIIGNVLMIFPPSLRVTVTTMWNEIDNVLRGFIGGNLLVACIIGVMVWLGLFFLGTEHAALLGLFYGLMNIIPYFGPFIGSVPVIIFPVLQGDTNLFLILLLLFTVQQIENNFISPRILGEHVGLHPVCVMILVLVGGQWGGVLGMIFSIPVAAVLKVMISFLYKRFVAMPID